MRYIDNMIYHKFSHGDVLKVQWENIKVMLEFGEKVLIGFCLFVLWFNVPSQQLRSCRDGQLT